MSLLILFLVLMIIPYSYLSITTDHKFYSPDETANYVFTKNFIETNSLKIPVEINKEVNNVIFPRSVNVYNGFYVPMSFLGLPIFYGLIGKVIGLKAIIFLTPILSLLSVFLFFLIVREIFDKNIALVSAILLLLNPIYWYLAGKAMLHNNLFLFLVIAGLFLLLKAQKEEKTIFYTISAICFGFSIWTRTSEIVWVGVLLLLFYWYHRKNVKGLNALVFSVGFCGMVLLLFVANYLTYDNVFRSGYSSLESTVQTPLISIIKQIFLPFGFNVKHLVFHVWEFFVKYLWFITIPAIWYMLKCAREEKADTKKFYLVTTIFLTLYLLVYYGSYWPWGEYGQPMEPQILIGSPHFRYWLPIFIFSIPFLAQFLVEGIPYLYKFKKTAKGISIVIVIILLLVFSFSNVYYSTQEGWLKMKVDIQDFRPRIEKISALVETNAVLIVPDWADRIFFPEHLVIHSWGDKRIYANDSYQEVAKLLKKGPIYYYSADSNEDIDSLSSTIKKYGLSLIFVEDIFKGEKLYQVTYDRAENN